MHYLKQSTASTIKLGPFLDDTDGKTAETGLTIAQADIRISKNGGAFAQTNNAAGATHDELGWYGVPLNTTDTATLGRLKVAVHESGALPCFAEFMVVTANVYDSLCSTDILQADVTQCGGSAVAAGAIPNAAADAAGGLPISDAGGLDLDTKLANTNEITAARMGALTDWINGGRLDNLLDAIPTTAMRGTDNATLAATWTDARAGYLDNLSAGAVALAAGVDLTSIHGAALTETVNGYLAAAFTKLFDVATPLLVASDVMRGTDGANTTVPDAAGVAATPAEVATALTDINLDHLVKIAVDTNFATTVHLDSVIGQMADVGTSATFDRTTDALEAIRDRGDAAWSAAAGNPNVLIDTTIAAVTDQTHFTLTAGSDIDDAYKDQAIVLYDASNNDYPSVRKVADYTGATKTVTLDSAPDFTIVNGDGVKTFVTAPGTTAPTVGQIRVEMEGAGYFLDLIKADTNELQTDWVNGGRLDLLLDAIPTTAMRGTDGANTTVPDAAGVAPTAAEIKTAIEAAGSHLALILADTGTDGVLLAATATSAQLVDDMWDEILSGATHNIAGSAGRRVREIGAYAIESGTAQAGNSHSITLAATASAVDGTYNRNLIILTDNTGVGQTRTIVDYNGTTKVAIIDRDWRTSPDATSDYQVTPDNTPLVVDQGVAQAGTATTITLRAYASAVNDAYLCNVVAIIAGTGRGQARLVGGYVGATKVVTICGDNWVTTPDTTSVYVLMPYGTTCTSCIGTHALGLINTECDTANSDYGANTVVPDAAGVAPTAAEIKTAIEAADSHLALILADTGELQTDWVNGGRLDLILDIIAADTTTDIPALIAALYNISAANVNTEVSDVMKTDTISEPSQGAPPATPTFEEAVAYLYFKLRNKSETTAAEDALYDDAGTTKLIKATISDDATTFTKGEYGSGA